MIWMTTLGGVDLGTVVSEYVTESSEVDVMPLPGFSSQYTIGFDYSGAKREIELVGYLVAANAGAMQTAIKALLALQTGSQTTSGPYNYATSILTGETLVVIINDMRANVIEGTGGNVASYRIRMTRVQ